MRPQHIGDRRVAVHDLEADAVALLELERIRLDGDVEAVDLAGLERLWLRVGEVRLHLGRALLVDSPVRGTQPALGDDLEVRVEPLGAILGRLRILLRELDDEVGIALRRGSVEHELDRPGDLEILSSGGVVRVSTRRAGSQFGGPEGPKPTTPLTQPG